MTIKSDLIEQILGLCPTEDLERLTALTRELLEYRDEPGTERNRFEGTMARGIPGYNRDLLRPWKRILVTGGTGCVGRMVLAQLVSDLPDAELTSVARRSPAPGDRIEGVTYVKGDIRSPEQMSAVMKNCRPDLVIHLAAQRNPALAESQVAETVSTNIVGSQVVLETAGECGVETVVMASTGKAVRLFTGDVYAATKMLTEYHSAILAKRYGMKVSCTRFTHVVDNSLVGQKILNWINADESILLHSPLVQLPVQSALECYHLLMTAGMVADLDRSQVVALRDLGWPPVCLLDLTLDYLNENPLSSSPIVFTGYPPGYEAEAYPGTYDPTSAGNVSPLVNCVEAERSAPASALGDFVDAFDMVDFPSRTVIGSLEKIRRACLAKRANDRVIAGLLRDASVALFDHRMQNIDCERVRRIYHFGRRHDPLVKDHAFIHDRLEALLTTEPAVLV
jgi:Polysaccharide biosynthesis protein